jgi:maleylacetate reductase
MTNTPLATAWLERKRSDLTNSGNKRMIVPGTHRFLMMERVVYGQAAAPALKEEASRLERRRVFIVTNKSLSQSKLLGSFSTALQDRYAGCFSGVTAHGPRQCVIEGAEAARAAGADLLVAIGGGSAIDAAKVMQLCLRHEIRDPAGLTAYAGRGRGEPSTRPPDADRWTRVIAVPTTLSAAEFTWFGGASDPARGVKEAFANPMMIPQVVIMDPQMTTETPMHLLLTTGMKAVDHAAERLASLKSNPYNDAVSAVALRLLSAGLKAIHRDPSNIDARAQVQYGAFMSMCGSAAGVPVGVGHAIGHSLGAHCGVPHGETSCTLLPSVMRWNIVNNPARQALIAEALHGRNGDAAAALAELITGLGLPTRLRDVGVKRNDFAAIAEKTMGDVLIESNARQVRTARDVEEILEMAW